MTTTMTTAERNTLIKDLLPQVPEQMAGLLGRARESSGLSATDFATLRDWLELADYADRGPLYPLLLVMFLSHQEGSLCVRASVESLAGYLAPFTQNADEATDIARRSLRFLTANPCERLIGASPDAPRPIIVYPSLENGFIYFQKLLRAETSLRQVLDHFLRQGRTTRTNAVDVRQAMNEVLERSPITIAGAPLRLDPDQRRAVALGLLQPLTIITGGPGTGKTSIVLTLVRCLARLGVAPERIALAAPTGRAAQRLTDTLRSRLADVADDSPDATIRGLAAGTLHSLLGYRPTSATVTFHPENPLPVEVVIVDEMSMVGLVLTSQLFQSLAPGTKVILLGDRDQLPSVDAGAVLANLTPGHAEANLPSDVATALAEVLGEKVDASAAANIGPMAGHVVRLRTNHRSEVEIRTLADKIRDGAGDAFDSLRRLSFATDADHGFAEATSTGGCWLAEPFDARPQAVRDVITRWVETAFGEVDGEERSTLQLLGALRGGGPKERPDLWAEAFRRLDRFRILTLVRDGAWGCVDINRQIDRLIRPRLDDDRFGTIFHGAPVLVVRNDARLGVFNGDVGLAARDEHGHLRVFFPRQGEPLEVAAESLPSHELGFALTVHKSQGSEYDHVLLVAPPRGAGHRLLARELVYTAVTRAKKTVALHGTADVFSLAIRRTWKRESGVLGEWLAGR